MAASQADCNQVCADDSSEICGASARLSVYQGIASTLVTPTDIGSGYTFLACYADTDANRAVGPGGTVDNNISLEECAALCAPVATNTYLGITYGSQCFCGSELRTDGGIDPNGCTFECTEQPGVSIFEISVPVWVEPLTRIRKPVEV